MLDDPPLPDWLDDGLTQDKLLEQCARLKTNWPLPENGGVFDPSQKIHELLAGLHKLVIDNPAGLPVLHDNFIERITSWSTADNKKLFTDFRASVDLIVTAIRNSQSAEARHSIDFASVYWFGTPYTFTTNQAACVRVLWDAWKNKTPVLSVATILEAAGVEISQDRLSVVFRDHPAWGTLIVEAGKGRYRLNPTAHEDTPVAQR